MPAPPERSPLRYRTIAGLRLPRLIPPLTKRVSRPGYPGPVRAVTDPDASDAPAVDRTRPTRYAGTIDRDAVPSVRLALRAARPRPGLLPDLSGSCGRQRPPGARVLPRPPQAGSTIRLWGRGALSWLRVGARAGRVGSTASPAAIASLVLRHRTAPKASAAPVRPGRTLGCLMPPASHCVGASPSRLFGPAVEV